MGGNDAVLVADHMGITYFNEETGAATDALQDCSFEIRDQEFVSIVGPSGCGKTTLLNAVAGLLPVTGGQLLLGGQPITGPGQNRGMVFQSPCLLPWRTALSNVLYGLELKGRVGPEIRAKAMDLLRLVGLRGFEHHRPGELSGGMQQRVNMARALAINPDLLLMDEPFAALDAQTREVMQHELLRIWQQAHKTVLFVTHQINEAVFLSDRVIVLTAGPGRVKAEIDVPLPRPRRLEIKHSLQFLELEKFIWKLIEEEVAKTGLLVLNE